MIRNKKGTVEEDYRHELIVGSTEGYCRRMVILNN